VISTCYSTFEGFIADNYLFYDFTECCNWLMTVIDQINEDPVNDVWLKHHTKDDVFIKLKGMFYDWKDKYEEPLWKLVDNLSDDEIDRVYYRNRLHEFTEDHEVILTLHRLIMESVEINPLVPNNIIKDFNKGNNPDWESYIPDKFKGVFDNPDDYNLEMSKLAFMDPNAVPNNIKAYVEELADYYLKYVYTRYMVFDRIYRLKNFGRKTVVVIDTDSNILALDQYMKFANESFGKHCDKPKENKEFIIINTITYTLTRLITDTLLFYGLCSNIPEEFRGRYAMKNEFFIKKLVISSETKKRYMSVFKLREGKLLNPPKTDIKGLKSRSLVKQFTMKNNINCWELS